MRTRTKRKTVTARLVIVPNVNSNKNVSSLVCRCDRRGANERHRRQDVDDDIGQCVWEKGCIRSGWGEVDDIAGW